ncbi:hypothetical protein, partial [Caldithrix abyssi]
LLAKKIATKPKIASKFFILNLLDFWFYFNSTSLLIMSKAVPKKLMQFKALKLKALQKMSVLRPMRLPDRLVVLKYRRVDLSRCRCSIMNHFNK